MSFQSNQTHKETISRRILIVALTMLCLLIALPRQPRMAMARTLEATVGFVLTDRISAAERHEFDITLSASQALRLCLRKGDFQLAVSIYDPGGVKTAEILSDRFEVLDIAVFAGTTGTYRIEMISTEKQQRAGNVELKIEELTGAKASAPMVARAWSQFYFARRLRQDWQEASLRRALVSYADANLSWKIAGDRPRAATALVEAGEVHFILGEYSQAFSLYQEAAAEGSRLAHGSLEFDALGRAALMHSYLGDNDRAEKSLRRVLDYHARMREPRSYIEEWNYANALHRMAEVFYARGNLAPALHNFQDSLKRFVQVGDRRGEARARLFIGYVYATIGEQTTALDEFKHAQSLADATGDQASEAFAVTAIGAICSRRSDWKAALELHRKAMQVFQTIGDTQSEAITLNGVGLAYDNQGDHEIALDKFREALKRFEANHSRDFAAATLYQIARVYKSIGDPKNALIHYELCVKASAAARKKRLEAYAMNDIAALYRDQTRALGQYRKSLNLFSAIRDSRGQALTLNSIGDVHRVAGHHREALKSYQGALDLARKAEDRKVELASLFSLARLEFDLHHLREAQSYLENSIRIIEDVRINVTSPDLRTSYLAAVHDHYGLYIDLLMRLNREFPKQGFAASAFRISESAHARALLEVLSEAKTDIKQGVDPHLDERRIDLERELKSKELYQNALIGDDRHQVEAEQLVRELQQKTVEYRSLLEQIRESNPRLKELAKPKLLNVDEVQGQLDQDSMLLEYSLGAERSYLWVVTRDSFDAYELPARKTIEDLAREVYALLTTRAPKDGKIDAEYATRVAAADQQYPSKSLELSRMLLGQPAARLRHRRLLIVVEGMLQYIPFDALPIPTAGAASDPLLVRHEVIVLPSFATLEATRREKPLGSSSEVVAVLADPVFSFTDNRVQSRASPDNGVDVVNTLTRPRALTVLARYNGGSDVPRLVHASEEADAIVSVAPRGTYLRAEGFEASRARIVDPEIGKYQILHLATHGLIDSEHPELSSVVLSLVDQEGQPADGLMLLPEIYNLKLSSSLVVLSACETAIGTDVKGEGLISLTRGFMYAGAKSVVASLWRVDDRATAQLMRLFYAGMLQEGLPPGEALQAAKEKLRRDPHWQAPYYWAGFVLVGEYREPIKVESRRDLRLTFLAVLFGLVTLCGLYLVIRRRRASSSDRSTARFI